MLKMKKTLLLLVAVLLTACSVDEQIIKSQAKMGGVNGTICELYVPEHEFGWQYYPNGLGLRTQDDYIVRRTATNDTLVDYFCYIANKLPANPAEYYTGQHDFVSNMAEDGIYNPTNNSYNFPGMLSIVTFCPDENGYYLPIGEVIKQRFHVIPTDFRQEIDPYSIVLYDSDIFMAIQAGTADNYDNKAKAQEGKNLVVIEVNPDLEIEETDYTNNVSTLPLNITFQPIAGNVVGHGTVDLSILNELKVVPPSNTIVTKTKVRGERFVKLDWGCPYHGHGEHPFYAKHWFTVKRNGVIIYDKEDLSEFTDKIQGNPASVTYTITTTVTGLGTSAPTTVIVTR